jgi:DNA polymerase-3 subunit delta'
MARTPVQIEGPEVPEFDRLEGVPHPRETEVLYGHPGVEQLLAQAVAGGRMPHGWLITGAEGIGKATLAYRLAKHLLAHPSERDPACRSLAVAPETTAARQVRALSHPGLLALRRPWDARRKRFQSAIPIDEVRRLRSFLTHTAVGSGVRVVIVDTADELAGPAANALLKSLEEPPPLTYFLVLSSEPGRLLATIRSRCRLLALRPLAATDVKQAAIAAMEHGALEKPSSGEWDRLLQLAEGSVGRLLLLRIAGGLELQARIDRCLAELPRIDWSAVHGLGDELATAAAEARFELFYDLLLKALAGFVRARAGRDAGEILAGQARRLIPEAKLASWAELWETLVREKSGADAYNLDRKSLILDTFRRIETAARA